MKKLSPQAIREAYAELHRQYAESMHMLNGSKLNKKRYEADRKYKLGLSKLRGRCPHQTLISPQAHGCQFHPHCADCGVAANLPKSGKIVVS